MSDTAVIKEFLVKLGFQQDEASLKKFTNGVENATKNVIKLVVAIQGAALTIGAGVTAMASKLEGIYYAAVKTGSSAKNLKAFGEAVANMGGDADGALQSVQSLARWMRETPGSEGFLKALGVSTRNAKGELRDTTDILIDLGAELAKKPYAYSKQYSDMLGIDEDTFRAMISGDFAKQVAKQRALLKDSGFDEAAKSSHEFMVTVRELKTLLMIFAVEVQKALVEKLGMSMEQISGWARDNLPVIAKRVAEFLMVILNIAEKMVPAIAWLIDKFIALDAATNGWSTKLIILLGVLNMIGAGALVGGVLSLAGAMGKLALPILAIAGAAATGAAIGAWINSLLSDETKNGIGKRTAQVLAFLGNDEAQAALDAEKSARGQQQQTGKIARPPKTKAPSGQSNGQPAPAQQAPAENEKINNGQPTAYAQKAPSNAADPLKFFMGLGWTKDQAAGIVANLQHESGMKADAKGDGGKAYGIAQWHPDRQANFKKWSGKDIRDSTAQEQMRFVNYELTQGAEKKAGNLLRASTNARQAGEIVSKHYERPLRQADEMAKRGETAVQIAQTTHINVQGGEAIATGRAVANEQERVAASMTRNLNVALN